MIKKDPLFFTIHNVVTQNISNNKYEYIYCLTWVLYTEMI